MKRWKKVLIGTAIAGSLIGGFAWYFGSSVIETCAFCWYRFEDNRLGPYLPPVDEVRVILLGGLKNDHAPFLESGISYYKILGQATLHDKDAQIVAQNWRLLPRNPLLGDLCHSPLYAFQFRDHGRLLLQTTICWHCNNYSLSTSETPWMDVEFGFDASSRISQALLQTLEHYVPLPPKK
jgi:hypothetical protein